MSSRAQTVVALLVAVASSSAATATARTVQPSQQPATTAQLPALKQLTIEELLQVDVTLPLRRGERVMESPAAITVLTNEDLRRQGAVSLPEALRHAPALHVARVNAANWIVASRGFAGTITNKMLVMVDGRSVYSPLFSGVFWNQQDTFLPDVDRVEIIRGPGASLWGSNAVNGVINVVSRSAEHTQGFAGTVGAGAEEHLYAAARFGGRVGAGYYRLYGKFFDRDDAPPSAPGAARDDQRFGQGGFRLDFSPRSGAFTLQGDVYRTEAVTPLLADLDASGANLLARWTYRRSPRTELQVQTYVDRTTRTVPAQVEETRTTIDVDVQHRYALSSRQTVSTGAGYRYSADDTVRTPILAFEPASRATDLVTAFVQSEFALTERVTLIGGLKVEANDYTGVEWQPSVRGRWMPNENHTVWAALSRAVRMPTRFDTDVRFFQGPVLIGGGNPDFLSETLVALEAGYRLRPVPSTFIDLTVFRSRYDDVRTWEATPLITFGNALNTTSRGGNVTVTVQPRQWVRLTGAYTRLSHRLSLDPGSRDIYGGRFETVDPKNMGRVQARFDLPRNVELDVMGMRIGELAQVLPTVPATPGYTEASLRLGWRFTPRAEIALIGRDILHSEHVEFISPTFPAATRIPRAWFTRLALAF